MYEHMINYNQLNESKAIIDLEDTGEAKQHSVSVLYKIETTGKNILSLSNEIKTSTA